MIVFEAKGSLIIQTQIYSNLRISNPEEDNMLNPKTNPVTKLDKIQAKRVPGKKVATVKKWFAFLLVLVAIGMAVNWLRSQDFAVPVKLIGETTQTVTPVVTEVSKQAVQTENTPVAGPTKIGQLVKVTPVATKESAEEYPILEMSKWILVQNYSKIEIGGICYGNAQKWDVLSKTGEYHGCTEVLPGNDLNAMKDLPDTLAVLPKGMSLPASHFYTENLLSLKALPEGKIWVCKLTSNEEIELNGEKVKVVAHTIKVLRKSTDLVGFAGGCYMVNSTQEYQTVTYLISMVNRDVTPTSPIYFDAEGWQGGWFGKHPVEFAR